LKIFAIKQRKLISIVLFLSTIFAYMNSQRTVIVTGAYGAIGMSIDRLMAQKAYRTILVGRDEEKLTSATNEIIKVNHGLVFFTL